MVQMNLRVPQAPERSSPVILSAAKDLVIARDRPFAALRVTRCDCSSGQEHFVQIEPCQDNTQAIFLEVDANQVDTLISNVLSNVGKAGGSLVHEHSAIE